MMISCILGKSAPVPSPAYLHICFHIRPSYARSHLNKHINENDGIYSGTLFLDQFKVEPQFRPKRLFEPDMNPLVIDSG